MVDRLSFENLMSKKKPTTPQREKEKSNNSVSRNINIINDNDASHDDQVKTFF